MRHLLNSKCTLKTAGCNAKANVKIAALLKIAINKAIYFYLCLTHSLSLNYITLKWPEASCCLRKNPPRDSVVLKQ